LLPGFFPVLPTQSRYNRRLRRLAPYLATAQLQIAQLVATGQVRLIDGTLIGCANYAGCKHVSDFAGYAAYGYCRSKSEWVWGVRLVLLSDAAGVPMGYTIAPANEREYEPCFELASAHPGTILFTDKGFWGAEFKQTLEAVANPSARCASKTTSPKPSAAWSSASPNASSPSPSASTSTPSTRRPPRALAAYDGR
jgi:hypothetical protein